MKKFVIATIIAACIALCTAVGPVKIYAQIYLQAPAE